MASCTGESLLTGCPIARSIADITLAESGKYYAFSTVSAFQALSNEVRLGGIAAAQRRLPLRSNRTVTEQLVTIATQYLRLPAFTGTELPDWGGGAGAFLECQGTYQHGVAALQASQVHTER